jgi:hypothetical protein
MQRGPEIQSRESGQPSGDRHSIAQQVFDGFLNTVRHISEMQSMVNQYHRD